MRRIHRVLRTSGLLVLMGLFVTGPARAQVQPPEVRSALLYTTQTPGASARLMGMGGVSIAGQADFAALFSNPAGLGLFQSSEVTGSFSALSVANDAFYLDNAREQDIRDYRINSLSYVYKAPTVRGSFVIGAAFNQNRVFDRQLSFAGLNTNSSIAQAYLPGPDAFELEVERGDDGQFGTNDDVFFVDFSNPFTRVLFDAYGIDLDFDAINVDPQGNISLDRPVPFLVPAQSVEQQGTVTEEGSLRELSFGGALEAARNVLVGASANFIFGTYRVTNFYVEDDAAEGTNSPLFDRLEITDTFESDLFGFSVRAGLSSEVAPGLQLGLMLETPTFYSIDERYATELFARSDDGFQDTYGDEMNEDAGSGEPEYSFRTPWRLGGGLSFQAEQFTIAVDAEFVDWTQLEFDSDANRRYFDDVNRGISEDFRAVVNTRLGAEYRQGALALRAGFAYYPDPLKSQVRQSDNTELDQSRQLFSAGIGYRFAEQFQLDFGWMQERFDDQYRPYAGPLYSDSGVPNPPVVDEEVVRNQFTIGMRFFF